MLYVAFFTVFFRNKEFKCQVKSKNDAFPWNGNAKDAAIQIIRNEQHHSPAITGRQQWVRIPKKEIELALCRNVKRSRRWTTNNGRALTAQKVVRVPPATAAAAAATANCVYPPVFVCL